VLVARHGLPAGKAEGAALLLLAAGLALGALVGVAWAAGFYRVAAELKHPAPWWFLAALAGEAVAYVGYALAYREVARVESGPKLRRRGAAAIVAAGFGPFVAGGGFHLDRHALRATGLAEREASIRVLGLGGLEYIVLASATCAASILLIEEHADVDRSFTYPWAIAVPAGFAAAMVALRYRDRFHGLPRRGLDAVYMLRCLLVRPRDHGIVALLGTALYWLGDLVALWACLRAFVGYDLSVPRLLLGYATGYALTRRTLPLGGAGIVEALLPFALAWVAVVPLAPAVLAVFAYRIFNLWLPLLPALVAVPHVRRMRVNLRR
jgi:uncharacterized membrane protein YbhN (UPF0104 family)